MDLLLFVVGILGFGISLVLLIISFVKKRPKKIMLIGLVVSVVMVFTGLLMDPTDDLEDVAESPNQEVEKDVEDDLDIKETETDLGEIKEEEPKEKTEEEIEKERVAGRKRELKRDIESRINEGEYTSAKLDKITINNNLGDEEGETYIALVYLKFDIKNRRKTANEMMKMYSDDLAATLANKGIKDIAEIAIFWEDEYNDRNVKYAYEYEDGQFFVTDIAGE